MMNPIKKFFQDKKVSKNFKKAGPGHRLSDESTSSSVSEQPVVTSAPVGRRPQSTEVTKRAAEAAIARAQQSQKAPVDWSLAAVRAQARKELESELQASVNEKQPPKEVFQESCPVLTVSGVYFCCPLVGPDILPYSEIQAKIQGFLYEQLSDERGLTSCLIIHSCNRDKEKVKLGVETLLRYLRNIMDNPTEEKYRKIRLNNKVFRERVSCLEGAYDFLLAAGFKEETVVTDDQDERYFIFPEEDLADIDGLQMLCDALMSAEPIRPELDRNTKVLLPSQATQQINLPDDFFNLSKEELKREQEARTQAVEQICQLRTQAMRERDSVRELRMYRYTLIRIRFPDGIILQGTFSVHEKLNAVMAFVIENLAQPQREFTLLAPGASKLTEVDSTLLELKLVPAVVLNLNWKEDDQKSSEETAYLIHETMCLLQNL